MLFFKRAIYLWDHFQFQIFPNKDELLRNMMGLLGNVAEVPSLRPELMDSTFLTVFYQLLKSSSDGIEVSELHYYTLLLNKLQNDSDNSQ